MGTMLDQASLYSSRKLALIEAAAQGRFHDARRILGELMEGAAPAQRGICRYCGCTEARGCAILSAEPLALEPTVARCEWLDPECTVCSNVSCLERWRREAPAEMDVDVHDATEAAAKVSRIDLP